MNKKLWLLAGALPLFGACVAYEKERVIEQRSPAASTVVVPQGSTAPSSTTVVVPQNSPPPRDTTIVVPSR